MGRSAENETQFDEPVPAIEIHADGIAFVKIINEDIHMLLYADYINSSGATEHYVVARLIMGIDEEKASSSLVSDVVAEAMRKGIITQHAHPVDLDYSEQPDLALVEVVRAPAVRADGVAVARVVDGNVHMLLYAQSIDLNGAVKRHVVARLVMREDKRRLSAFRVAEAVKRVKAQRRSKMI